MKLSVKTYLPLWIAAFTITLTLTVTAYANAQDAFTYAPEHCEFSITFPEKPEIKNVCEESGVCYDEVKFTQVFELSSTVKTRVICNAISSDVYESYSGTVMKATLKAMTNPAIIQTSETSFRETEDYKQAGLVGEGMVGRTPTLYVGQLWIGKKSALSVEAEIIGAEYEPSDSLFSEILRSVGHKDDHPPGITILNDQSP